MKPTPIAIGNTTIDSFREIGSFPKGNSIWFD
jgi:hypothetical protein